MPQHGTPVDCYDYNMNFVKHYKSLSDAYAEIGAHPSNIRRAARQGTICAKHYWKLTSLRPKQKTAPLRVWQWLPNGTFLAEYASCMEAARITGAPANNIARAAKGMHFSCGGYRWTFAGTKLHVEPNPKSYTNRRPNEGTMKPVVTVPVKAGGGYSEADIEHHISITNATIALGLPAYTRTQISKVVKGIRYTCGGYYWFNPDTPENILAEIKRREEKRAHGIAYRIRRGKESIDTLFR